MKALKFITGYLFLIFILSSCMRPRLDFSEAVTYFHKDTKGTNALFFYPAVINTLNFTHDSTFTDATKNIQKIEIVRLSKDSIPRAVADTLTDNLKSEKFVVLMEMFRNGSHINLFVKKHGGKADHFVAVVYSPTSMIAIDLLGEVPLKYIPELLSSKNMTFSGFETVLNAKPKRHNNHNNKESKSKSKSKSQSKDGNHTRDK